MENTQDNSHLNRNAFIKTLLHNILVLQNKFTIFQYIWKENNHFHGEMGGLKDMRQVKSDGKSEFLMEQY